MSSGQSADVIRIPKCTAGETFPYSVPPKQHHYMMKRRLQDRQILSTRTLFFYFSTEVKFGLRNWKGDIILSRSTKSRWFCHLQPMLMESPCVSYQRRYVPSDCRSPLLLYILALRFCCLWVSFFIEATMLSSSSTWACIEAHNPSRKREWSPPPFLAHRLLGLPSVERFPPNGQIANIDWSQAEM